MTPSRPEKLLVVLSSFVVALLLFGCGTEKEAMPGEYGPESFENSIYQSAVINGTNSYDDCYDVSFMGRITGPGSDIVGECSAFRVSRGLFVTAAHCVVPTRPAQSSTSWKTDQLLFTRNPYFYGRNTISEVTSIKVMVPPGVGNYSDYQWTQSFSEQMIAVDVALVITDELQSSWDYLLFPSFTTPSVNSIGYVAGYGVGNTSLSDNRKRRYGAIRVIAVTSAGALIFQNTSSYSPYTPPYVIGSKGDSGGPIYASDGGQNRRQFVGLLSADYSNPSSNLGYNYSPNLGSGPTAAWLSDSISQGYQLVKCMRDKNLSSKDECVP